MVDDIKGPGLVVGGGQQQSAGTPLPATVSPANGASTAANYLDNVRPGSMLDRWAAMVAGAGDQAGAAWDQGQRGYAIGRALAAGGMGAGGAVGIPIAGGLQLAKSAADTIGEGIGAIGRGIVDMPDQRSVVAAVQNAAATNAAQPPQQPAAAPASQDTTTSQDTPAAPKLTKEQAAIQVRLPNPQGDAMEKMLNNIPIGMLPQYMSAFGNQADVQSRLTNSAMLRQQIQSDNQRATDLYRAGRMNIDQLMAAQTRNLELLRGPGMPYYTPPPE